MTSFFYQANTRYAAKKANPGAAVIAKVCGGFKIFETVTDYKIWKAQK